MSFNVFGVAVKLVLNYRVKPKAIYIEKKLLNPKHIEPKIQKNRSTQNNIYFKTNIYTIEPSTRRFKAAFNAIFLSGRKQ